MTENKGITAGVSYYPDHWPREEWERDMKLIKESGLDIVRFGEFSWYWIEPEEGKFDFSGYDRFMNIADKLDLKTVLCTPTAAVPTWVHKKYPESKLKNQHGETTDRGRHMTCYDHSEVKKLAQRMIVKLAERYRDHPALMAWQIGNEPTLGESCNKDNLFGYNPETVNKFRDYLKDKYQILDKLNEKWIHNFWSRSYSSWDEIEPPKKPNNPGLWLEWLRFRCKNVVDYIKWQLKLLRAVNENFIIGTNIPETGPLNSSLYGQNYWDQCKGLDYVGLDIYAYRDDEYLERKKIGYSCDLLNSAADSAGADFWISETQAGPHRRPWRMSFVGGLWGPEFLKRCTEEFVTHGAEKVLYFLWRPVRSGAEFGMNGMVNFDGTPHEITRSVEQTIKEAKGKVGSQNNKQTIYLHYSRDSLHMGAGYDPDDTGNSTLKGWYNLITDLGYRVKFINDDDLLARQWEIDEILLLPYTLVMSDQLSKKIGNIMEKGTKVISGFAPGFFDEYGRCNLTCPGEELEDKIGVRIKGYDIKEGSGTPFLKDRDTIKLDVLYSEIDVIRGEVLLSDSTDKPLIVGNENVFYFAFDMGTLYNNNGDKKGELLRDIIKRTVNI